MFAQDLDMKEISRTQCTKEKYKEDIWVLLMWGNGNEFGKAEAANIFKKQYWIRGSCLVCLELFGCKSVQSVRTGNQQLLGK